MNDRSRRRLFNLAAMGSAAILAVTWYVHVADPMWIFSHVYWNRPGGVVRISGEGIQLLIWRTPVGLPTYNVWVPMWPLVLAAAVMPAWWCWRIGKHIVAERGFPVVAPGPSDDPTA
ncbi:MAG TPA: hypothetical protein VGR35_19665 [Tepidisphaeraceae bacterium]|nr:hypothetical protein [Tepidisphaeraceae bacterium]